MNTQTPIIKIHNEKLLQLDKDIKNKKFLSNEDASFIIENLLDVLVEVGNGTTDEELHKQADYLFALRDKYLKPILKHNENIKHNLQ